MNKKYRTAVLFGAAHGLNDFIAGYLLAHLSIISTNWQLNTLAFLGYSIIAFGGQLPLGILVDRLRNVKFFSVLSLSLMTFAIAISYLNIYTAILFSAFASAFIHVCGGAVCYLSDDKNSTLSGIFTAPGVVGLISGGIVASLHVDIFYLLLFPLFLLIVWLVKMELPSYSIITEKKEEPLIDTHDFFMLILLLAIAFRSVLWNVVHVMCFDKTEWLLEIAFSAGAGKLIGGYLTYKVNWKRFVFISVLCAVLFLNIGKGYFPALCVGVALLQSAVPVTLLLMQQYMQNSPATASGLSLGVAIVLAGLPSYIEQFRQIQTTKAGWLLLITVFLITNTWMIIKVKWKISNNR